MGLYNILFGVNQAFPLLMKALNLQYHGKKLKIDGEYNPGRFRDIYLSDDGTKVILFTRNGGGNRECPEYEYCPQWDRTQDKYALPDGTFLDEINPEHHDSNCLVYVNWKLTQHPLYIRDYDDDFDCTYAYFEFRTPEVLDVMLDKIMEIQGGPPRSVTEKFNEIVEEMREMPKEEFEKDPRFGPLVRVFKDIFAEDKG